jgi:hypothetical protein
MGAATPLFLWSTNTYLKYRIQEEFRGLHYVWCSPTFEAAALPRYAVGAGQPASSDPATIYRQLHHAVKTNDNGDAKIISQKKVLKALAISWFRAGAITEAEKDEIVAMVKYATISDWRPLIFVIPYATMRARTRLVPRAQRVTHEPEYIVSDLTVDEFHIVEPIPCP